MKKRTIGILRRNKSEKPKKIDENVFLRNLDPLPEPPKPEQRQQTRAPVTVRKRLSSQKRARLRAMRGRKANVKRMLSKRG
jgi:hypothetical protein